MGSSFRGLLTLVAVTLTGVGCDGETSTAPRGKIGLSVLTLTNPFFKTIADSIEEEAQKLGYEVVAVSGELDVHRQQNQVKDFIVGRVAAIVLTPCDSKAIGPAIREANRAWIPVFTADIACLAKEVDVVCHVATDNYGGGREAARAMIKALKGRGRVAIIDYPEIESVILRTNGFEDEVREQNRSADVHIEIVAKLPGEGARDRGFQAAQDLLQAHPDLDGIFAINDPSALGAVAAIENAGRAGEIVVVGFDGQREGKQAIRDGRILADPVQFPDRIGAETVRAIHRFFLGEAPQAEILIPTRLYWREDSLTDAELRESRKP